MKWELTVPAFPQPVNKHPGRKAINSKPQSTVRLAGNQITCLSCPCCSTSSAIHLSVVTSDKSVFAVGVAITSTASQGLERLRAYPGPDEDFALHPRERNSLKNTHNCRPVV
jgi:hypothetical protein